MTNECGTDHIPAIDYMRRLPQFAGDPLDLEALGVSLYSLLVNPALHMLRILDPY